jgi:hypothetical protein
MKLSENVTGMVAMTADRPDALMLLGTAVIFASGLYTFHRGRVRHRRLAATPAAPVPS